MRWLTASPIVSTLLLTLGLASSAQAAPEMFAASFVFHAWGNDISSGNTWVFTANDWTALPLGYDCQHRYPTTVGDPRYCTPAKRQRGHPATGTWTRSIGTGTPPIITMQQSDIGVYIHGWLPNTAFNVQNTYATFVNRPGSFFAGGGPAAGAGYHNKTIGAGQSRASWRIQAGKNGFGGAMGFLGNLAAQAARLTLTGIFDPTNFRIITAVTHPVPLKYDSDSVSKHTSTVAWHSITWSRIIRTSFRYHYFIGWTTGTVIAATKCQRICTYYSPQVQYIKRTGYDNRTTGGKGNIQLVTPVITRRISNSSSAAIGILTIRVPEPMSIALLITGLATLCGLYRLRRR